VTDEPSVRCFVDENSLVLGRLLARQRHDVVHPGHRLFPEVPVGSKDDVWLPIVGERGLILITRDKKIRLENKPVGGVFPSWRDGHDCAVACACVHRDELDDDPAWRAGQGNAACECVLLDRVHLDLGA
jgi:hypothetical protein